MILKYGDLSDSDETTSLGQTSEGKNFEFPKCNMNFSRINRFSNHITQKEVNSKSRLNTKRDSFI